MISQSDSLEVKEIVLIELVAQSVLVWVTFDQKLKACATRKIFHQNIVRTSISMSFSGIIDKKR